ncbi:GNAT family N-acetyltransferase [Acinetobacter sp. C26M]|uniref:GNAT family N-acetyltransferase n=1 Tax=unclassified Acinetobacter TaxID=196816 RepID=UPI002036B8DB|nr:MULTISPECIES: GNAT family N-acetyltransferase [unclassified Acinetobacter]USA46458.1 GNAT family N-acetyltransferase [Acinetobacter sp. C26M]USA49942.1 GNAT family N-acetyltransferase [Acinetobacter sp. C26G]
MYSIQSVLWKLLAQAQQDQLKTLLLEADPSWAEIETYLFNSKIFVILNDQAQIIAQLCLLETDDQAEIKNLTVADGYQGQGLAKALIQHVIESAKQLNTHTLWVKTGNSSLNQLALYQKCGFRLSHIERDVFKNYPEPIYENGIACLDQVVLGIVLG